MAGGQPTIEVLVSRIETALRGEAGRALLSCFGHDDDERDVTDLLLPEDYLAGLDSMDPEERQAVLSELAGRTDLWKESEVTDGWD